MRPHRDRRLEPRTPRILHLDVDAFLASVEQALHPELRGRPVVVGGSPDSRNLVMSCSYEARAFGVRPGLALAEARRRCPRAVFRDGDSQAANRLREGVARVLLEFSPRVEIASIDDFLVDLTGATRLLGAAVDVAGAIRERVRRELHLPLSIGIGTNVLLARLAGKLAKPGGVGELLPGCEQAFLDALPVRQLPGVGHAIGAQLERFGLATVGELRRVAPRELLFASFGRDGLVIHERARGIERRAVEPSVFLDEDGALRHRPPRSIRRDSTFEPEEGRPDVVGAMLAWVVERAAHRLRAHGLACGSLEVRLRYVATGLGRSPAAREGAELQRRRRLDPPTDSTDALAAHARRLFDTLPRRRALVKRLGVTLLALRPAGDWQGHLFDPWERIEGEPERDTSRADRQRALDGVLDAVRARHGFGRVLRGSTLPLARTHRLGPDGFVLRTPSLNQ